MKRIHSKLPPMHIQKIVSKHGLNNAAKRLGITPTAINKYLKDNKAPQTTEMAAQMIFEKETGEIESTHKTALIRGEVEFINIVSKMAKISHGSFTPLD